MLLSLVGEVDILAHTGVRIAIGIIGDLPPISKIIRKQRHHKFSRTHAGAYSSSQFSKPNFQELLTDLQVVVGVDSSAETGLVKLTDRLQIALATPDRISRFGGLSLGESWSLVNGIRSYRVSDGGVRWLAKDPRGLIGLPVWIDRSTTRGTFCRFSLGEFGEDCWVSISV
jgi:CRISPR-associated protein Cas5t